jgi:hypothetical protein
MDEQKFYNIFKEMYLSLGEIKYIFNMIDINNDKNINGLEFINFMDKFL